MAYHNDGFVRVGAATPRIKVADCEANRESVRRLMEEAAGAGVQAMVFPELCLTGYTCGDLFQSGTLLAGAEQALRRLLQETEGLNLVAAVGLPVAVGGELYNCAAVLCRGRLLGLAAKVQHPQLRGVLRGAPFFCRAWLPGGLLCRAAGAAWQQLAVPL